MKGQMKGKMMNDSTELEKIVGQLEDSPGHILGLNGWLLRTLPKEKRAAFLRGFEKLIRVAYFPDHAADPKSRGARERYIQSVSNAISYLTGDEFAYDLAVEEVPTEKNPVVILKRELEQKEHEHASESSSLKNRLDEASTEIKTRGIINADLQRANKLGTEVISALLRMQRHNSMYLSRNRTYEARNANSFSIRGQIIDFNREKGIDQLHRIIFGNYSGLDTTYDKFQEILENNFLNKEKEELKFRNRIAKHGDYSTKILGSITLGSIREFLRYRELYVGGAREDQKKADLDLFRRNLMELPNATLPIPGEEFGETLDITSFSIPMLNIGLPIILKETSRVPDILPQFKHSLFYVTGINLAA